MKLLFRFSQWQDWLTELNAAIEEYYTKHQIYPNAIWVNEDTFFEMENELTFNLEMKSEIFLINEEGFYEPYSKHDRVELDSLELENACVDFLINTNLMEGYFYLSYEVEFDPDDGGEYFEEYEEATIELPFLFSQLAFCNCNVKTIPFRAPTVEPDCLVGRRSRPFFAGRRSEFRRSGIFWLLFVT